MTEDPVQIDIIAFIRAVLPSCEVLHIPNEGKRSFREGKRLHELGLLAGAADLLVMLPGGRGIMIEVKSETGPVRRNQIRFGEHCDLLGWPWFVARSRADVRTAFEILNIEMVSP